MRKRNAFDVHLELTWKIEETYRDRDSDPTALQKTIDCCWTQIMIADEAKQSWLKEFGAIGVHHLLPTHKGYEQLCIIFEKQKRFNEAIKLATQAKAQGWDGDWAKRIERCRNKSHK